MAKKHSNPGGAKKVSEEKTTDTKTIKKDGLKVKKKKLATNSEKKKKLATNSEKRKKLADDKNKQKTSTTQKIIIKKTKRKKIREKFRNFKKKRKERKAERYHPYHSFRRSYREDYVRETNVPGVTHHVFATFGVIFKNWKVFLPLLVLVVILWIVLVGMMEQNDYVKYQDILDQTSLQVAGGDIGSFAKAGLLLISTVTSGGLSGDSHESAVVFGVLIFILTWLTTIFLIRHIKVGHKVKLRDALYNAMSPFVTSLVIFVVAVLQCIPIIIFIVVLSAAIQTDFLATPFYALVFFIFATIMISLSGYMLSSSIIALVAVSAPGLYPMRALHSASDLMMGRRTKFIIRLLALIITLVVTWVVVMMPMILFDMFMKQWEWTAGIPFVPICLVVMTCFTGIYLTAYLYLYYRWLLNS